MCGTGGELQRFALAVVALQKADIYMIDEPSSYLDVRQRLKAAEVHFHDMILSACDIFLIRYPALCCACAHACVCAPTMHAA